MKTGITPRSGRGLGSSNLPVLTIERTTVVGVCGSPPALGAGYICSTQIRQTIVQEKDHEEHNSADGLSLLVTH